MIDGQVATGVAPCAPPSDPTSDDGPQTGRLDSLLRLMGGGPSAAAGAERLRMASVSSGRTLFREGGQALAAWVLQSGAVKLVRAEHDGSEQVLGFAGRGAVLGLEGLDRGTQACTAVALVDACAYLLPFDEWPALLRRHPPLEAALWRAAAREARRAHEVSALLAAHAAEARLARFLLQQSAAEGDGDGPADRWVLPMTRRDIAAHLGMAEATVCRAFGAMVAAGLVAVAQHELSLLDREALHRLARSRGRRLELPVRPALQA